MSAEFLASTRLAAGESLRIAVDAGAMLLVEAGSVHFIPPPAWLGESMVGEPVVLREGECHAAPRGGWVEVRALSAASVRGIPQPAPAPRRLWSFFFPLRQPARP